MNCTRVTPLSHVTSHRKKPEPQVTNITTWLIQYAQVKCTLSQIHLLDRIIKKVTHSIPPIFIMLALYYFTQLPTVAYTLPTLYAAYVTLLMLTYKYHSDGVFSTSFWSQRAGIEKKVLIKNEWLMFDLIKWNVSMIEFQAFLKHLL
jgi:hypothetical protein